MVQDFIDKLEILSNNYYVFDDNYCIRKQDLDELIENFKFRFYSPTNPIINNNNKGEYCECAIPETKALFNGVRSKCSICGKRENPN